MEIFDGRMTQDFEWLVTGGLVTRLLSGKSQGFFTTEQWVVIWSSCARKGPARQM